MKEFFAENRIVLKLDGTYASLADFFDRVRKMDRIVSVTDFKIVGPLNGIIGKGPSVNAPVR